MTARSASRGVGSGCSADEARQGVEPRLVGVIPADIGPLGEEGLVEAFGLAVGLRLALLGWRCRAPISDSAAANALDSV